MTPHAARVMDDDPVRPGPSWVWGAGGAMVATAATIAAITLLSGPGTTGAAPGPAGPSSGVSPTSATRRAAPQTVSAYYVGDAGPPRLFSETYAVEGDIQLDQAFLRSVIGGADDPDYGTLWPRGTMMQRTRLADGVLSVYLVGAPADRPDAMSVGEARLALQQLVWSAQSTARTNVPVTFVLDGRPTATLLGEPTDRPVSPAAADDVLAPVSIREPGEGATVDRSFVVHGEAAAFEANVQWELMRGDTVFEQGATTAEECCTLSPYSFTVQALPGDYTLVVHDEDVSGEGLPPWQDTKNITVR